ncbi:MAG: PadR family transcriptional regulator [Candidatus Bathyarchaeota archaeon]|nr:PadR family transcriptional regulator [Candidatus Bathyarchaeota archaeon]
MKEKCCPEPPTCCDMRGLLSFYILWLLSKRRMNGQEISEELKKRRGAKPTAGTIYPALKELRTKSLVEVEKQGRETIYTLTESGKKELEKACTYFCSAFGEIFEDHAEKQDRQLAVGGKTLRRA